MAIKIREAEYTIYDVLLEEVMNMDYSTSRNRNKFEKAQARVIAALSKKLEKLAPKVTTTNAS